MSKCIRYDPCPECGSKDNLAVYDDGHSHCYGCGYTVQQHNIKEKTLESAPSEKIKPVKHGLPEKAQTALEDRGLDKTTVNKYKVTVGRSEEHTSELQSLMRISYAVFCLKKKKSITWLPSNPILETLIHNLIIPAL